MEPAAGWGWNYQMPEINLPTSRTHEPPSALFTCYIMKNTLT